MDVRKILLVMYDSPLQLMTMQHLMSVSKILETTHTTTPEREILNSMSKLALKQEIGTKSKQLKSLSQQN